MITFKVEIEREDDRRWLAEVVEMPGVLAYGETQEASLSRVQALALRVIAEQLEHGETGPELLSISSNAARAHQPIQSNAFSPQGTAGSSA